MGIGAGSTGRVRRRAARCAALLGWTLLASALLASASCASSAGRADSRAPRAGAHASWGAARAAAQQGDWWRAAQLWREEHARGLGEDPRVWIEAGEANRRAGRSEDAHDILCSALERFPTHLPLIEARAELAQRMGFLRAAQQDYETALALAPERAALWRCLGEVRLALAQPEAATPALERAVLLEPTHVPGQLLLARAARARGAESQSAHAYARALDLAQAQRGVDAHELARWQLEAASLYARGELARLDPAGLERALGWAGSAAAADFSSAEAHSTHGALLERAGDRHGAQRAYGRALDAQGEHGPAMLALSRLYLESGDRERAGSMARLALEVAGDESHRKELRSVLVAAEGRR
jgi:tetratricopeptide (TPR) repeat protein